MPKSRHLFFCQCVPAYVSVDAQYAQNVILKFGNIVQNDINILTLQY